MDRLGIVWILALLGACTEAIDWARDKSISRNTFVAAQSGWREWLQDRCSGSGDGSCYGSGGYGYGDGSGDGSGYGSGDGSGDGYGYGYGYGDGSGYGYGYGGYGYGSGYGYGYGYGELVSFSLDIVEIEVGGHLLHWIPEQLIAIVSETIGSEAA